MELRWPLENLLCLEMSFLFRQRASERAPGRALVRRPLGRQTGWPAGRPTEKQPGLCFDADSSTRREAKRLRVYLRHLARLLGAGATSQPAGRPAGRPTNGGTNGRKHTRAHSLFELFLPPRRDPRAGGVIKASGGGSGVGVMDKLSSAVPHARQRKDLVGC